MYFGALCQNAGPPLRSAPISSPAYTSGDLGINAFCPRRPIPPPEAGDDDNAVASAMLFELPKSTKLREANSKFREVFLEGGGCDGGGGGGGGGLGRIRGSIC